MQEVCQFEFLGNFGPMNVAFDRFCGRRSCGMYKTCPETAPRRAIRLRQMQFIDQRSGAPTHKADAAGDLLVPDGAAPDRPAFAAATFDAFGRTIMAIRPRTACRSGTRNPQEIAV
ncbi:hypothetical protein [Bradyrhizobium sp. USDA 4473]